MKRKGSIVVLVLLVALVGCGGGDPSSTQCNSSEDCIGGCVGYDHAVCSIDGICFCSDAIPTTQCNLDQDCASDCADYDTFSCSGGICYCRDEAEVQCFEDQDCANGCAGSNSFSCSGGMCYCFGGEQEDVRLTIVDNGPSPSTVPPGTNDVDVLLLSLVSDADVIVRDLRVEIQAYDPSGRLVTAEDEAVYGFLKNLKVVDIDNGYVLQGPLTTVNDSERNEATSGVWYQYKFTENFDITALVAQNLAIRVDVDTNFPPGYSFIVVVWLTRSKPDENPYIYVPELQEYVNESNITGSGVVSYHVTVEPDCYRSFKDVPCDAWYFDYVEQLVDQGLLDTTGDYFQPNDPLNRAELVKIVITAIDGLAMCHVPDTPTFDDVPAGTWYYDYIECAAQLGIVSGYIDEHGNLTGMFGPGDTANRAFAVKVVVISFAVPTTLSPPSPFSDVTPGQRFHDYVLTAYNQSVVDGYPDGTFRPAEPLLRAYMAKWVVNAQDPVPRFP